MCSGLVVGECVVAVGRSFIGGKPPPTRDMEVVGPGSSISFARAGPSLRPAAHLSLINVNQFKFRRLGPLVAVQDCASVGVFSPSLTS